MQANNFGTSHDRLSDGNLISPTNRHSLTSSDHSIFSENTPAAESWRSLISSQSSMFGGTDNPTDKSSSSHYPMHFVSSPMSAFFSPRNLDLDPGAIDFSAIPKSIRPDFTHQPDTSLFPPDPTSAPNTSDSPADILYRPQSIETISRLYEVFSPKTNLPVDAILLRAEEALTLVSECLKCYSRVRSPVAAESTSSLLVCVQTVLQVSSCYSNLRSPPARNEEHFTGDSFRIGDFHINPEMRKSVLEMVIARGLSDCRSTVPSFEAWEEKIKAKRGDDKSILGPFMQSLQAS